MTVKEQTITKIDFDSTIKLNNKAMLSIMPELFHELNFEKNEELGINIYAVSAGSNNKIHWICSNGHTYKLSPRHKIKGVGCGYCASRRLLAGFNDLATTNPKLSSLLFNSEDGQKYMQFSKFKVDWKCPNCNRKILNKRISDVSIYGLSCPDCTDGIKYPEKVMREVLNQLNLHFIRDEPLTWSNNRRYDFYLPDYNIIIEAHGGQHYNGGFKTYKTGNTLEQELDIDREKEELAMANGIEKYIIIDCRESKLDFIKENILNSELPILFNIDSINWSEVETKAQKSVSYECLLLWNSGLRDIEKIAEKLSIHREMVRRYLKQWSKLDKCDFGTFSKAKRKIVQLDQELNLIKEWESIAKAHSSLSLNKKSRGINKALDGSLNLAYGSKWMYKNDYEDFIKTGDIPQPSTRKALGKNIRKVVKLDLNGNYLDCYDSIKLAAKELNIKTYNHITSCCREKRNSCGGFKWMYKEDFDKLNSK